VYAYLPRGEGTNPGYARFLSATKMTV